MEEKESHWQISDYPVNAPKEQDRAEDLLDNWRKYGYVMFPQQRRIYQQIAERIYDRTVIEFGCGAGVGTAIMATRAASVWGTDVGHKNVEFARCLYPWIRFTEFDLNAPCFELEPSAQVSVAVEVLEHVADPIAALKNLIAAASEEVWISTPNGTGKKRPPENPYHVCEYTTEDMIDIIASACCPLEIHILGWDSFEDLPMNTIVDPLVYRIVL